MTTTLTPSITALRSVEPALRDRLVTDLNRVLSALTDQATAYKQAHWNVVGPTFAQLHALFDTFAGETRECADEVAERAVTLGGIADGTLQAAAQNTPLPPFPRQERDALSLVAGLAGRLDSILAELRAGIERSEQEPATQDLYVELTRGLEKQRWMLTAHLAGPGGAR